jgi:hypothetical protein
VKKSLKEIGKEKEKEGKREKIIKKHYLLFTLEEKKKKKKIYFAYVKLCNAAATSTPTDTAEVAATTAYLEEDQLTWNHDSEDSAVVNESAATKGKCLIHSVN